jgi:hypothetical protein
VRAPEPTREEIATEKAACEEYQTKLAELRRMLADLKLDLTLQRLREKANKANFNPAQLRVPAGSREGGQWTSGEGGAGRNDSRVLSDVTPDNEWEPGARYAAAKPQGGPPDRPPEVPQEKPPTAQERNRIARAVARWRGPIGAIFQAAKWLYEHHPEIQAYRQPPKTLEESQQAATEPSMLGYDKHHIVLQAARKEKDKSFPDSWIDSPENIVRISRYKHWEIHQWYETPNGDRPFNDMSPREYLHGKDWSERYQMGLDVLTRFKVLKP